MGRMFRMMKKCMYPKTARGTEEVMRIMPEWEGEWGRMESELGVKPDALPGLWKMAAMMEIVPKSLQDSILMRIGHKEDADSLEEKIIGYVTNKVEASGEGGAVPMDCDYAAQDGRETDLGVQCGTGWDEEWPWDETEINALGQRHCYACGEPGHIARDCGKAKTKGKSGKVGFTKGGKGGKGKDQMKGKGKGGLGKGFGNIGKGTKGTCKGYQPR